MSYVETACRIAREAGALIKERLSGEFEVETKSSEFDVVTEIDKESERLIRESILKAYPGHAILGEEESFLDKDGLADRLSGGAAIPYLWVVDPIDGTSNYVKRIPGFTVSIALFSYGQPICGAIYDPMRDELFSAEKGGGAFLNGAPIRVSATDRLAASVVSTGFPSNRDMRAAVFESLQAIGEGCRTIRALGSAALHLAYVAAGKLEAFWEYGLNCWDMGAGVVIIQEAGGRATDTGGQPYSLQTRHIAASNGAIHDSLLGRLHRAD